MGKKTVSPPNLGTARSPIDFGQGNYAYRRNGRWRYRNAETMRRFGRKFLWANDHDLIIELESRGYQILYPGMRGPPAFAVSSLRENCPARNPDCVNSSDRSECGRF